MMTWKMAIKMEFMCMCTVHDLLVCVTL